MSPICMNCVGQSIRICRRQSNAMWLPPTFVCSVQVSSAGKQLSPRIFSIAKTYVFNFRSDQITSALQKRQIDLHRNFTAKEDGNTALHYAATRGRTDMVVALVDAGADPNLPNADDLIPAEVAAKAGFVDLHESLQSE